MQAYISALADRAWLVAIRQLHEQHTTTSDDIMAAFKQVLDRAASSAGYRRRSLSDPPPPSTYVKSKYKVWHDDTCKFLQHRIRALNPHKADPVVQDNLHLLLRIYRRRVKRLLRQHNSAAARQKALLWKRNKNSFWRWYKPNGSHCPFPAKVVADHFQQKLNSYAGAPPSTTQQEQQQHLTGQIDIIGDSISVAEIITAIMASSSTAAGIDGIPTALIKPTLPPLPPGMHEQECPSQAAQPHSKDAVANIAEALHLVYDVISKTGKIPTEWQTALLIPIYKGKGQLADISSYRPLSVPPVACRVWSSVLNRRLMQATTDIMPDEMFGFRPDRRTADPLFVLRHLSDMNKAGLLEKFGVAFMDLSGAYDSVDRNLLFQKLTILGMSENSVNILRNLYSKTRCMVKCDQGTFAPFDVGIGLRQGCPLSTTLFNLFIWDLHKHLHETCPGAGVEMHGAPGQATKSVIDLDYADDVSLAGRNPTHLQQIIDSFHQYCVQHGLLVNPSKCEVVIFCQRSTAWASHEWLVGGQKLPRVEKFKYLGVELYGTKGIRSAVQQRLSCMVASYSRINRRLYDLKLPRDPALVADLFDCIAGAAGSYGCEVWSTSFLGDWSLKQCPLQSYQAAVYKHALGVRRCTGTLLAFHEIGRYPLQLQWLLRTVRYWNKLVLNKAGSNILSACLAANVHFGLRHGVSCWAQELCTGLQFIEPSYDWKAHLLELKVIDQPKAIVAAGKAKFRASILQFDQDPSIPECPERWHHSYRHYMHVEVSEDTLVAPAYVSYDMPLHLKKSVARLRLSGAKLRAVSQHSVPYDQRLCQRCNIPAVDNEHHMLLECTHTGLEQVRAQYAHLFENVTTVKQFMMNAYQQDRVLCFSSCIHSMMSCTEG